MQRDDQYWEDLKYITQVDPDLIETGKRPVDADAVATMKTITNRMVGILQERANGQCFDLLDASVLSMLFSFWKGLVYGDSWRKHGEAVSIFGNVARKFDRLAIIFDPNSNVPDNMLKDEPVETTVLDLLTYVIKWVAWIPRQGNRMTEMSNLIAKAQKEFGFETE
jgi:hypothetical protein